MARSKPSRSGRYVQKWLGEERWDIPVAELSPDCATALSEAVASALENGRPHQASAHCVRDGMVRTYDLLALPTASRWGPRWLAPTSTSGCAIQSPGRNLLFDR